jgi:hypothetical protein
MGARPVDVLGETPTGPGTPTDDTDANGTPPAGAASGRRNVVYATLAGVLAATFALLAVGTIRTGVSETVSLLRAVLIGLSWAGVAR